MAADCSEGICYNLQNTDAKNWICGSDWQGHAAWQSYSLCYIASLLAGGESGNLVVQGSEVDGQYAGDPVLLVGGIVEDQTEPDRSLTAGEHAEFTFDTTGALKTRQLSSSRDSISVVPLLSGNQTTNTKTRIKTANSTAVAISTGPGNLYAINLVNGHSTVVYVKFYDIIAASVNPASSQPVFTVPVAASGGYTLRGSDLPIGFATACSVRCVTEFADTGTTAPGTLPIIEVEFNS